MPGWADSYIGRFLDAFKEDELKAVSALSLSYERGVYVKYFSIAFAILPGVAGGSALELIYQFVTYTLLELWISANLLLAHLSTWKY